MDKINDKENPVTRILSPTVTQSEQNNKDNNNDMLIFENGTILGAIFCDSTLINNYSNSVNNIKIKSTNQNLSKSQPNLTTYSTNNGLNNYQIPILLQSFKGENTVLEGVLYQTTNSTRTAAIPSRNLNSIIYSEQHNNQTSLIDTNASYDSRINNNNSNITTSNTNFNNSNNNNSSINTSDYNSSFINNNQIDLLNSSTCSFESRLSTNGNKQCNTTESTTLMTTTTNNAIVTAALNTANTEKVVAKLKSDSNHNEFYDSRYHPPQYSAIYFDAIGNAIGTNANIITGNGNVGGIGSVVSNYFHGRSYENLNQIHHHQQQQQLQQQQYNSDHANNIGIVNEIGIDTNQYSTVNHGSDASRNGGPVEIIQRGRGCFRPWFTRPSLPFVIGVLALGGVACTLGGIVLGSTGLVEHSTQYLSAALLMIGIGVSLLVISGAIWRLSIPDEVESCPCFRHLETCRNCNSPYCGNRLMTTHSGYMYPEFQHRPPPPSYVTSLNECTVGLLFHHEVANLQRSDSIRISTPPPAYRSSQSLSVFVPLHATVSPSQRSLIPEFAVTTPTRLAESDSEFMNSDNITIVTNIAKVDEQVK